MTDLQLPPEGMNEQRSQRAHEAILTYDDVDTDEDPATVLTDLLSDLMHWCNRHDVDFDDVLRRSKDHYWAETQKEVQ